MAREWISLDASAPIGAAERLVELLARRRCTVRRLEAGLLEVERADGRGLLQICRGALRRALPGCVPDDSLLAGAKAAHRRFQRGNANSERQKPGAGPGEK